MTSRLPLSLSGSYKLNQIVGSTGVFPNRIYNIKGVYDDYVGEYGYFHIEEGDMFHDYDGKKYEVLGFDPEIGPLFLRDLVVREKPEGNTGLTGISPSLGVGTIFRENTFSDLIISSNSMTGKKYYDNFMAATRNCCFGTETQRASILCGKNMINDADDTLMVNEICNMASNIISDQDLKKDIVECTSMDTTEQFTKFKNVKTYNFRFNEEPTSAPVRTGFIAQDIYAQFPHIGKTTFTREHRAKKNSSDQWIDLMGNVIDTGTHTIIVDSEHSDRGCYYTTENRDKMCIDSIALLELMWSTCKKLIEENDALKVRVDALENP